MAEVRADVAATGAAPTREERRWWELRIWPAAAVLASVAAIALFAWNLTLVGGDEVSTVTASGTSELPMASATVAVLDDDTIVITAREFPRLNVGNGYEVWLLGAGGPVSAGFLSNAEGERALAVTADLAEVSGVAITAEPVSNTTAPTTPILLESDLPT